IRAWDDEERRFATQRSIATVNFHRDATDAACQAEKAYFDEIGPARTGLNLRLLAAVCTSEHREALEQILGGHALRLWDCKRTTFRDEIAEDRRRESALTNEYSVMLAELKFDFDGQSHTLSTIRGRTGDADRRTRRAAVKAMERALSTIQPRLDAVYDELVQIRTRMAKTLGYDRYTELGYQLLSRTDYGPDEVAVFRDQLVSRLVPLALQIRSRQAARMGISADYSYPDESVSDDRGVPRPKGDHDWMLDQAEEMFSQMGADFGAFFSMMRRRELLDLKARDGKTGGGFCTAFEDHKVPFIFANFNGTQDDVNVFTHECGHAFQNFTSRDQPLRDYLWPTLEACEIHSMGLESLTYPYMELFFGDDADRFREGHLETCITFIPYMAAIDDFQHRVYATPSASPDDRAAMWQAVEARYMPWRRYVDLPYFGGGRFWQRQRHVYSRPFYYIDYALAQLCALQLWSRAQTDREGTMEIYRQLCELGGSMSFTDLLAEVGLESPFAPGAVGRIVDEVRAALKMN
ncbi:MAG: M3 family oligoendopeptidase, partial [Myxococcota bacterium]